MPDQCIVLHDLFGYLSCHLKASRPQVPITYASQKLAVSENAARNNCPEIQLIGLLDNWAITSMALMKIPKSIDLFRLYLSRLAGSLDQNGLVMCGFMTRNFTPAWLKMAREYFEEVTQTKAQKKARIMILKNPKPTAESLIDEFLDDEGNSWKQYLGVFSAGRIDLASRFLMDHIVLPKGYFQAVDVGSGNGVLAHFIKKKAPEALVHLTDDNFLAYESGKLNLSGNGVYYHFSHDLSFLSPGSCDLVVTNPPFHFEYEINLDVAFQIFKEAYAALKGKGELWVVANNNLPYKTQLSKLFKQCKVIVQNRKFIIYRCLK